MLPSLSIQLFGEFRLEYDEKPLSGATSKRMQLLLSYLLLHRDAPQSRQQIAFRFWPDSTDKQARTNLRNLLHRLGNALPETHAWFDVTPQTVQWNSDAPYALDVTTFEAAVVEANQSTDLSHVRAALERALHEYGGVLLPDNYDDWILAERERLSHTYLYALAKMIDLLEGEGDFRAAISYAQRLVQHDPLREATYLKLMQLHVQNNDRASALRIYHTCATLLLKELGVEPGPAIHEVYLGLLNIESPAPPLSQTVAETAANPPPLHSIPLVGREPQWRILKDAWHKAAQGHPHLAMISGEAGIGKTRLAEELLTWAGRQDVRTADAECYATGGSLAYAPVVSWLRCPILQMTLSTLENVWLAELTRLLPELRIEHPTLSRPAPLTEALQRQYLFEALARAFLHGHQPLILQIDDLQWCDADTLAWLDYLLHFDPQARLLIVGTVRTEELLPDHPLVGLLPQLRRNHHVTAIELKPMDATETAALAEKVAGQGLDSSQKAHLYAETEGNPLFVVEMARADLSHMVGQTQTESRGFTSASRRVATPMLPPKMQTAIATRLAQLSPAAREVANVAATIGREFTLDILASAGDYDEETVVRGLDELWQRRIVRERARDAYSFSHDKLREVIYEEISPPRRIRLHRKAAFALELIYEQKTMEVAARLARHYTEAGATEPAIRYWLAAGEQSQNLYAQEEAINCYEQALVLLKKEKAYGRASRTLMRMGLTYHTAFDFKSACRAYDEGFRLWQAAGESQTPSEPSSSTELLLLDWRDPLTLDPTQAGNFWSAGILSQLYSGLVELSPGMEILPDIARSWEVTEGGYEYIFHLRRDVSWSDGTPVTAHDFVYAWKRALSATGNMLARLLLSEVKRADLVDDAPNQFAIHALDDFTLRVEMEEPTPYLLYALAHPATFAVPQHAIEILGDAWAKPENIVTNGPFRLESWIRDERMTFSRNPTYHGRFTGNSQRVEWLLGRDPDDKLAAYEAGQLDVLSDLVATAARAGRHAPASSR